MKDNVHIFIYTKSKTIRPNGRLSNRSWVLAALLERQGRASVWWVRITSQPLRITGFTTVSDTGIWDWTRRWGPVRNMSTVWPNHRQGIIFMLSGGMTGRFLRALPWKSFSFKNTAFLAPIGTSPFFYLPSFWGKTVRPSPFFLFLPSIQAIYPQKYRLCWPSSL